MGNGKNGIVQTDLYTVHCSGQWRKWMLHLTIFLPQQNGVIPADLCAVQGKTEVDSTADHLPHPSEWDRPN